MKKSSDSTFISLKYIFQRIFQFKSSIFLLIALNVIWALSQIALPFATKAVIDIAVGNNDLHAAQIIITSIFALFLINIIGQIFPMWVLRHIGVRISLTLISDYFKGVLQKSFLFFSSEDQGETIQNVNDNLRIESFITTYLFGFAKSILHLILYAGVLLVFSVKIAKIFILFNLLYFLWYYFILKSRKKVDEKYYKSSSKIRGEINELFRGIVDLKSNNQELVRINNWDNYQNIYSIHRLNLLKIHLYSEGFNSTLQKIRDLLILYLAVSETIDGSMTLGSLIAIQYIMSEINDLMRVILDAIPRYQDAKLSVNRINNSLAGFDPSKKNLFEVNNSKVIPKSDLSVKNLDFEYIASQKILKNIDFSVPYGSSLAILGESGSGKSTLLKVMLKLLKEQNGKIQVGNLNLKSVDEKTWLYNCSVVLQESVLFSRTLLYNITFKNNAQEIDFERVWRCLEIAQAKGFIENLGEGLNTVIGYDGIQLSKGQQQRILLARLLYKDVDYYFMDEPFSAMDRLTYRRAFHHTLEELKEKTVVIVTHKMEVAKRMDKIILVEDGCIVEEGSHDDLVALGKRYMDIFISDEI